MELALKAFLSANGITLKELAGRKYGHSLGSKHVEIRGDAAKFGGTKKLHNEEIARADKYYSEKVFEYPAISEAIKAYPRKPNLAVLCSAAKLLVTCIEALCLSTTS